MHIFSEQSYIFFCDLATNSNTGILTVKIIIHFKKIIKNFIPFTKNACLVPNFHIKYLLASMVGCY